MKELIRVLGIGLCVHMASLIPESYGQVTQGWVARYVGPGGGWDSARALGLDSAGNVYVTGHNGVGDYATVKYDSSGNQLWVACYDGPLGDRDLATALAVDAGANVYVTGYSVRDIGYEPYFDYATVKYDSSGNQLWVARYSGVPSGQNYATAIAVDGSGHAYVTGFSHGPGTGYDYTTIKYDSLGNEVWVARYNNPGGGGNRDDLANSLAVDAAGNVYVTGTSYGLGTSYDVATVKYDSLGQEQWVARYNGPVNGYDEGNALAVDGEGNVYVAGYADFGPFSTLDYVTLKYDRNGRKLWMRRYQGPDSTSAEDVATDLALDAVGNVYVTGWSIDFVPFTEKDYATLKYDGLGNLDWVARYAGTGGNNPDEACAVKVDAFGNAYVTGYSVGPGIDYDYVTLKYGPTGNEVWAARYDGPGQYDDEPYALAVDSSGNVYVTGESWGGEASDDDYATVKYVPSVEVAFSNTPTAVYRREMASWQYRLTSTCDTTQTFDWSLSIRGPITRDLYLGQKTLGPHGTESGTLRLRVPRNAPLGSYMVIGTAGVWSTLAPWDQTSFNCSVVGVGNVESKSTEDWSVEVR